MNGRFVWQLPLCELRTPSAIVFTKARDHAAEETVWVNTYHEINIGFHSWWSLYMFTWTTRTWETIKQLCTGKEVGGPSLLDFLSSIWIAVSLKNSRNLICDTNSMLNLKRFSIGPFDSYLQVAEVKSADSFIPDKTKEYGTTDSP